MHLILSAWIVSFLALTCVGFDITIPVPISVGVVKPYGWTWNKTDASRSPAGAFVAMAVNAPESFDCDTGLRTVDNNLFQKIVESSGTRENPSSDSSGTFFLSPTHEGPHVLCAYGNLTFIPNPANPGQGNFGSLFKSLSTLILLQQKFFDVSNATATRLIPPPLPPTTTTTLSVSSPVPPTGEADQDSHDNHSSHRDGDDTSVAGIVGGVVGAVALVFMALAIFLYRRLRYQRKLNQFHKERMLFQQQPPPTFLSSNPRVTSPLPIGPLSPTSTTHRRSEVPAGFEMHRSYQFSTEGDSHFSPPSYSPALPNEPGTVFPHHSADFGKQV